MNRRIAHAASVAALVLALVLVPAAVAGRGKGHGQGNNTTDPSLTSSCNPCDAGTFAHFTGSGYDASQPHATTTTRPC